MSFIIIDNKIFNKNQIDRVIVRESRISIYPPNNTYPSKTIKLESHEDTKNVLVR